MRILVISNLYPPASRGGYELLCAETVERLRERHEVTVLTSSHEDVPSEPSVIRQLAYLPPGKASALRAPAAALAAAKLTRRVLAEVSPELVFVWNGAAMPQAAIRIAELSGAPVAYSVCEYWFERLYGGDQFMRHLSPGDSGLRAVWAAGVRLVNRHPSLHLDAETRVPASISWVSEALRKLVQIPPTIEALDQRVIYTGVHDPDLWTGIERRPPADPPLIAFVGRLEEQKGPDVAYRALAALRDEHQIDARLVLAGRPDPEMSRPLERLAGELGIRERVEQLGQVAQPQVAELLGRASALVVPSTWQEPSGGICLEGGLARVPVVASRSGGMPEGLREEEHALYFDIDDHRGAARALARVLGDPRDAAERATRAFERAREFTFDRYMERMHEFVDAAVRAHRKDPAARV
ncbi:MAG TPA: glycosyltransferase family 4 protein [Thermoleophilaceae bacterium]|nr:glycosyltransferase family 4 protein [Thermoleophilaceae bacterium]